MNNNPQSSNYQAKQFYENKQQVETKKPRPRESEPPLMQQESMLEAPSDYKGRKPRPSEIGFEAKQPILNRNNTNPILSPDNFIKKGMNQTKNEGSKYKEDFTFEKKNEMTLQSAPNIYEYQAQGSSKNINSNRFLSPDIKLGTQTPVKERKNSQNFEDITFFKGYRTTPNNNPQTNKATFKPENPSNNRNPNISGTQSLNTEALQQPSQKRTPRFSEPQNFSLQDDGTGTLYNQKISSSYNEKKIDQKETSGSGIKSKDITNKDSQKKINPPIEIAESEVGSNSAFKKFKELKETVSTHSTFDSKKLEINGPTVFKKQSKTQDRFEKSGQLKVSDFIKGKELGSGKFGEVCVVKHKLTGFVCALKSIPKAMIREENIINQLIRQLKIQTYLDHPNIIKLYGFFHDKDNIYLLLELGSSGQLYKVIKERTRLSEGATAYVMKQVCEAIRYLHTLKIIHRDLKPENIVIQSGTLKLCDFGWAVCRGGELRSTFCGTPLYVSPEILKGQLYDQKIDLWAIGILTFQLLFGNIPFEINTQEQLIKIIKEDIVFPSNIKVSFQAKDFILRILKKNPDQRLKIGELLDHDFLRKAPETASQLQ